MSPNGVGGGDCGLAGVPSWDPGGVSVSIPMLGADVGCETYSSSNPQIESSCSSCDSSSSGGGGGGGADGDEPKKQGGAASSYIRQEVCPLVAFYADVTRSDLMASHGCSTMWSICVHVSTCPTAPELFCHPCQRHRCAQPSTPLTTSSESG